MTHLWRWQSQYQDKIANRRGDRTTPLCSLAITKQSLLVFPPKWFCLLRCSPLHETLHAHLKRVKLRTRVEASLSFHLPRCWPQSFRRAGPGQPWTPWTALNQKQTNLLDSLREVHFTVRRSSRIFTPSGECLPGNRTNLEQLVP